MEGITFNINRLNRVVNYSFLGILLLITAVFVPQQLAQSLVGHWKMDENGGGILVNASTSIPANDGFFVGGPSWVMGVDGFALDFNGSSQYAAVAYNTSLDITDAITLAAWIRPDKIGTMSIIKKNGDGTGYELY